MKTETYRSRMREQQSGKIVGPEGTVAPLCQPDDPPSPHFLRLTANCHLCKLLLCGSFFVSFLSFSLSPLLTPSPPPICFSSKTHSQRVHLSFLALRDYGHAAVPLCQGEGNRRRIKPRAKRGYS